MTNRLLVLPAVADDGSGVRWVGRLDTSHEHQEGRWVVRDAVIRPGRELELSYFTLLWDTVLEITSAQV